MSSNTYLSLINSLSGVIMLRRSVFAGLTAVSFLAAGNTASAQFGTVWQQPAPVVWQQPGTVVMQQPGSVVWQQPAPTVWRQPAPVVWQQPSPVFLPSGVIVQQPAMTVTPMPVTRVYRAPIIGYQPTRQVVTRRRPVLGGTSSRVVYGYRRVVF